MLFLFIRFFFKLIFVRRFNIEKILGNEKSSLAPLPTLLATSTEEMIRKYFAASFKSMHTFLRSSEKHFVSPQFCHVRHPSYVRTPLRTYRVDISHVPLLKIVRVVRLRRKIIRIFFVAVWQFGSLGNHQTAKLRSLGPIKANQKTSKQLAVWQFGQPQTCQRVNSSK